VPLRQARRTKKLKKNNIIAETDDRFRFFANYFAYMKSIFPQTIDFLGNILYNVDDRKNYKSDFIKNPLK